MAAYIVAGVKSIADQAKFEEYRAHVGATMAPYGGKYLAAAPIDNKEGNWPAMVTAIIEFPSMDAINQWYDSEGYRELKQLRQRSANLDMVFVEGF